MNEALKSILAFDFDQPLSDYGFSTRLARENFWTLDYTQKAIVEYKKFMYLAANSPNMVAPSKPVDTVWHQHLVFTQSYADFCALLGKTIQHIPSTRKRSEEDKFRQAKLRTLTSYQAEFGKPPGEIWEFDGMYASLRLQKARFKIRSVLVGTLIAAALLVLPLYYLLRPIYINIDSRQFLITYFLTWLIVLFGLSIFNRVQLKRIFKSFDKNSFVHFLQAEELIYLLNQNLEHVVHAKVNDMVADNKVIVTRDNTLQAGPNAVPNGPMEWAILNTLSKSTLDYASLVKHSVQKRAFTNITNSIDALQKYITKSAAFGYLFYFNLAIVLLLVLPGVVRLLTGVIRERPVGLLVFLLVVFFAGTAIFLVMFSRRLCFRVIPAEYKARLNTASSSLSPSWRYFFGGTSTLAPGFAVVVSSYMSASGSDSSSSSSDSSSSSSCGSDGGSSCGGCGGGGD